MTNSLADHIAPQLPYLRRFARALSGSQERGDAYVVALLETLVADQGLFDRTLAPRVAAYTAFLKVWNTVPTNHRTEDAERAEGGVADRRIETLTPEPRQAFVLAGLEDFSANEIATIMGRSEEAVRGLIDEAAREIAEQLAARVMIIEDEPLIAMDVESLVSDLGHSVVGIAATRTEATALALRERPEMVLADIHLADGSSGLDAVNDILRSLDVPVVFITAYPERLLTGERPEPAFLVTKPFKPEMLKAVISQALFFDVKAGKGRQVSAA
ncbi:MAG: response regulator [Hyphomicrobiaceae bacterium]|nr:response regulator [Hyphomicrobiaceae bacterium]